LTCFFWKETAGEKDFCAYVTACLSKVFGLGNGGAPLTVSLVLYYIE